LRRGGKQMFFLRGAAQKLRAVWKAPLLGLGESGLLRKPPNLFPPYENKISQMVMEVRGGDGNRPIVVRDGARAKQPLGCGS
jgi:hypothetical protein